MFDLNNIKEKLAISKNISGWQTLFAEVTHDAPSSNHHNWGIAVPGTDWVS